MHKSSDDVDTGWANEVEEEETLQTASYLHDEQQSFEVEEDEGLAHTVDGND